MLQNGAVIDEHGSLNITNKDSHMIYGLYVLLDVSFMIYILCLHFDYNLKESYKINKNGQE